jgi:hypothetical protein
MGSETRKQETSDGRCRHRGYRTASKKEKKKRPKEKKG